MSEKVLQNVHGYQLKGESDRSTVELNFILFFFLEWIIE